MAITWSSLGGKVGSTINRVGGALGNPLPDMNLSESLQSWGGAGGKFTLVPKAYASSGPSYSSPKPRNYTPINYSPYVPQKTTQVQQPLNQQSGGSAPEAITTDNMGGYDFTGGIEEPNQELELINREFDDFNNYLNQQQTMSQGNFDQTKTLMDTQKANALSQYGTEKTQQTEGIKKNESLNLAKVRQLLSDLQQSNAARTAITGGTGSASEAMAERFGRRAQEGLSNVTNTAEDALQRVNTFYNQAITKLNDNYNANLLSAKTQLDENLANISYQRNQSATAKQQQTLSAWRNYYDNLNRAKLEAAQFKAQYDMWKQQNDTAYSAWGAQNQGVAADYNTGVAPSLNVDSYKNAPGIASTQNNTNPYYKWNPTPGEEDEEAKAAGLNYSPIPGSTVAY